MSKTFARAAAVLLSLTLVAAACGGDDEDDATGGDTSEETGGDTGSDGGDEGAEGGEVDAVAAGLWDDGPCDESLPTLHIGQMTTFSSPVISLEDSALALEAAVEGFNARGGANGACLEVTTCDDGANLDQAVECVRTLSEAGVVATVNDQGTAGQAEVSAAMQQAGIPRVASNVTSQDWGDQNAYPLDASGTGVTFLMPKALIEAGVDSIGVIRVDSPGAGILIDLLAGAYEGEAEFPLDVPVPAGTTDFSQFILRAQDEGVGGIALALGEQEAVQVLRAGQQLDTQLTIGSSIGTFSHATVTEFGDFAEQMAFVWAYPPATATDIPAYDVLRADMNASGEEGLQTANLKGSPMRSWIGLYALLAILREAGTTDFTSANITAALQAATDVDMLGIYGDATWTPNTNQPGLFQRLGIPTWRSFSWDPEAEAPEGLEGNWVENAEFDLAEVICGSPFGAPAETC